MDLNPNVLRNDSFPKFSFVRALENNSLPDEIDPVAGIHFNKRNSLGFLLRDFSGEYFHYEPSFR